MIDFVQLIANFYSRIFGLLNSTLIISGNTGISASLGSILFVCLVIGFAVSIFWRGAKA